MNNMFLGYSSLKELNLCNFITDKVVSMNSLFIKMVKKIELIMTKKINGKKT